MKDKIIQTFLFIGLMLAYFIFTAVLFIPWLLSCHIPVFYKGRQIGFYKYFTFYPSKDLE